MKDNETIKVEKTSEHRIKIISKKSRIAKIVFPIVVITITAVSAVGVSFAIKNVNKQEKKTGELGTPVTYSKIITLNKIYK